MLTLHNISYIMRKPDFVYPKTKSQISKADQHLCFRYTDQSVLNLVENFEDRTVSVFLRRYSCGSLPTLTSFLTVCIAQSKVPLYFGASPGPGFGMVCSLTCRNGMDNVVRKPAGFGCFRAKK